MRVCASDVEGFDDAAKMYYRRDQHGDMEYLMAGTVYIEAVGHPSLRNLVLLATIMLLQVRKCVTLAT
jgi:hypothetical protein